MPDLQTIVRTRVKMRAFIIVADYEYSVFCFWNPASARLEKLNYAIEKKLVYLRRILVNLTNLVRSEIVLNSN